MLVKDGTDAVGVYPVAKYVDVHGASVGKNVVDEQALELVADVLPVLGKVIPWQRSHPAGKGSGTATRSLPSPPSCRIASPTTRCIRSREGFARETSGLPLSISSLFPLGSKSAKLKPEVLTRLSYRILELVPLPPFAEVALTKLSPMVSVGTLDRSSLTLS